MKRRDYIIILILVLIVVFMSMALINMTVLNNSTNTIQNNDTANATTYRETLANNSDDPGTVEVIRNVGNPNGEKIAYVVGVHPLEHETHETLVNQITNTSDLKYCYDVYIINVTEDVGYYGDGSSDNSQGRQNGQNLAYNYVYPQIVNGSYKMAVDIHSNVGAYPYQTFVFSPVNGGQGEKLASDVAANCSSISYYAPPSTTSGPYLTVPLNENGIPAFYFEEYSFATQDVKDAHMTELISAIDGLDL